MSRNLRLSVFALAAVAALLLLVFGAFGIDRALHADEVLRNVSVGESDLSGMKLEEAQAALQAHEDELVTTPALFQLNDATLTLDPETVGFIVDEQTGAEAAMNVGRSGSIFQQFGWWWNHLATDEVLDLPVGLDSEAFASVAAEWSKEHIADPPFDGAITVDGITPVAEYPASRTPGGRRLGCGDRPAVPGHHRS